MIGAKIVIDKLLDSDRYYLMITLSAFDKENIPEIKTDYKIISHKVKTVIDPVLEFKHQITLEASLNPRPESLIRLVSTED